VPPQIPPARKLRKGPAFQQSTHDTAQGKAHPSTNDQITRKCQLDKRIARVTIQCPRMHTLLAHTTGPPHQCSTRKLAPSAQCPRPTTLAHATGPPHLMAASRRSKKKCFPPPKIGYKPNQLLRTLWTLPQPKTCLTQPHPRMSHSL
jgi:hypothetical protein